VVRGRSATGKTEWAKSLFSHPLKLKIGALEHFPAGMRAFTRGLQDGLILDDVRDLMFVVNNQEKLQGKYDALVEFASTPGGALSYSKDLFAVPTVVTVNYSTKHLDLLHTSDWLKLPENRLLLVPPQPGWRACRRVGAASLASASACNSKKKKHLLCVRRCSCVLFILASSHARHQRRKVFI
jgi:hypothetical protein